MLLEFSVGNFLSFKEMITFSLEAGSITELKDNVTKEGKYKVLRSAVIYGANSSGKSNFIKALDFMVTTIKNSSKINSTDKLNVSPFLLNVETENQPSFFEILFVINNGYDCKRYRYGFEIDNDKVHSEWLYILNEKSKKEDVYFVRNNDGIGVADIFEEYDLTKTFKIIVSQYLSEYLTPGFSNLFYAFTNKKYKYTYYK